MTGPKTLDGVAGFGPRQTCAADHRPRSHRGSGETRNAGAGTRAGTADPRGHRRAGRAARFPPASLPRFAGAVAAALVIGAVWFAGVARRAGSASAGSAGRYRRGRCADVAGRRLEATAATSGAPAPDPAVAARIEALEKSVGRAARRTRRRCARSRTSSPPRSMTSNQRRANPRRAPDLAAINDRVAQLERATRAQTAEIAQANAKPADDAPLRRVVAAALLDVLGSAGRSLRGGAGGGEIAGAGSGCPEAARSHSRPRACRPPRC